MENHINNFDQNNLPDSASSSPERIMIVEDNVPTQRYLSEILGERYKLKVVSSGEEALETVDEFRPSIVLLDVAMQGINGFEVCKVLRSKEETQRSKIIFLTAKSALDFKLKGYKAGGDDYLVKPFEEQELLAKLEVFSKFEVKANHKSGEDDSELDEDARGICYEIKRKLKYITHIKADSPYCNVYYQKEKGDYFRVRISIKNLETFFKNTNLIRVHRSYLVNTRYISNISTVLHQNSSEGQILINTNDMKPIIIPIGKSYQSSLKNRIPSFGA